MIVAEEPPIVTVAALLNPVPVMVTRVPPFVDPLFGEIEVIVGEEDAGNTVNAPVAVTAPVSVFVTTTSLAPAPSKGALHVIEVVGVTEILWHVTPPIVTLAFAAKPVPVIVIGVLPPNVPVAGLTEEIVGAEIGS